MSLSRSFVDDEDWPNPEHVAPRRRSHSAQQPHILSDSSRHAGAYWQSDSFEPSSMPYSQPTYSSDMYHPRSGSYRLPTPIHVNSQSAIPRYYDPPKSPRMGSPRMEHERSRSRSRHKQSLLLHGEDDYYSRARISAPELTDRYDDMIQPLRRRDTRLRELEREARESARKELEALMKKESDAMVLFEQKRSQLLKAKKSQMETPQNSLSDDAKSSDEKPTESPTDIEDLEKEVNSLKNQMLQLKSERETMEQEQEQDEKNDRSERNAKLLEMMARLEMEGREKLEREIALRIKEQIRLREHNRGKDEEVKSSVSSSPSDGTHEAKNKEDKRESEVVELDKKALLDVGYTEDEIQRVLSSRKGPPRNTSRRSDDNKKKYMKMNTKYLLPQSVKAFDLPWEFDKDDPNYIIIKRWIPVELSDQLFEHTRKIRKGEIPYETEKETLYVVRKKSPSRRHMFDG
ncbi:hypothetical protein FQN50_009290 [Emmonsiellopsis sp. PD_5]|nr:hypothetical protein FQN50_009290 [Emmonsiellopsis sp. PD_5]